MSLKKKTIIGIFWNLIDQLGRRGVSGVVTILLAFFLTPDDFGLVAMTTVFMQISNSIMDSGFKNALIQNKNVDDTDYSTVYYINIVLSLFTYALLYLFAPSISLFYSEQKLITLLRIIGITVVINSFKIIQETILVKNLEFKSISLMNIPGILISSVFAYVLAKYGYGVWAIVAQSIIASIVNTLTFVLFSNWKPKFLFSFKSAKRLYKYGSRLFLAGFIEIVFNNIYIVIIAKFFSSDLLGYYYFAKKVRMFLVTQLNNSIQKVTFPALVNLDNKIKLKDTVRKLNSILANSLFPFILLFLIAFPSLAKFILNDNWINVIPYIQIVLLGSILNPFHSLHLNIYKVIGRSDIVLGIQLGKKILVSVVIIFSINYGIFSLLFGQFFCSVISFLPNVYISKKLINYSIKEQLFDIFPPFIYYSLVYLIVSIFLYNFNLSLIQILILIFCNVVLYLTYGFLCLKKNNINLNSLYARRKSEH